jgi:transcriptional regulator with XRE-family HTH domain
MNSPASPIPPQVSLRVFREAKGVTLSRLAELIQEQGVEVHPDTLSNIELGYRPASKPLILAWARALGVEPIHIRQARELAEWLRAYGAERSPA